MIRHVRRSALTRLLSTGLAALAVAGAAEAQGVEVDLELALMVDVSRSMSPFELEIQRRGYAAALRSPTVLQAIRSGPLQRIAVTYVEWAGSQQVIVPWRLLETQADLEAFADTLDTAFSPTLRRTSISGALDHARRDIASNDFAGWRQVIDVSGDGPNNEGRAVTEARDAALAEGIVINGLPLMTRDDAGLGTRWHIEDLDLYYEACVIGGYGSFVIPVLTWEEFADAVLRKLVLEIAWAPPTVIPAQARAQPEYDCLIGEKMWAQRQQYWSEP